MNITYDQKLIDYMTSKGLRYISVEALSVSGCVADTSELLLSFVKPAKAEKLKANGCAVLAAPVGEVLVVTPGLHYEEDIRFSLKSFLGVKDIQVTGLAAWTF